MYRATCVICSTVPIITIIFVTSVVEVELLIVKLSVAVLLTTMALVVENT